MKKLIHVASHESKKKKRRASTVKLAGCKAQACLDIIDRWKNNCCCCGGVVRVREGVCVCVYVCYNNGAVFLLNRRTGVRRGRGVHTGAVRGEEQVNQQGDLLPHDMRHRHQQHSIRLWRGNRRNYCQQSPGMRSLLGDATAKKNK